MRVYKAVNVNLTGGFRDIHSSFGNQLVRITSNSIPSTTHWKTVGIQISTGF
jgi:hypothetical protein